MKHKPDIPAPPTPSTLDDVARVAGVSTATVSRCINDPEVVSPQTRERVQTAIDQLAYTPNFAARSMASRRTNTIGAIIPTMENAIFARGLQAFQEEINKRGYTLLVSSSVYSPVAEEEQIRTLVARGADGLLLIGHHRAASVYDYLERRHVPVLVAWTFDETARTPCVGFDNRSSMRALTEQVIAMGHRRIAMISGISKHNDRAHLRIEGVRDAMTARGLDPATLAPVEVPYGISEGTDAFVRLMADRPDTTIVLCGNDVLATGAVLAAEKLGLSVPGDISITGFDDIELAEVVTPHLTTVHVPHRDMGKTAAAELVSIIEEKRPGVSRQLPANIVFRGSLGPAPNTAS